jgi:hypothetical protein
VDTRGEKEKRTSKKNVDGRRTSSHGNKTFRSRSLVKQKGMVFGFRKTATAVVGPEIEEEIFLLYSIGKNVLPLPWAKGRWAHVCLCAWIW